MGSRHQFEPGRPGLFPTGDSSSRTRIVVNTCGIQGPPGDNVFEENVFKGNVANFCL